MTIHAAPDSSSYGNTDAVARRCTQASRLSLRFGLTVGSVLLLALGSVAQGQGPQVNPAPIPDAPPTPTFQEASPFSVSEKGPNHRIWQRVLLSTNFTQGPFYRTNAVTELAMGMHYWDGIQWAASSPNFEVTQGGYSATHTQHKVQLNSELLVQGAVQVTTRDGVVLHSTPLGIGLYDAASGNFLLIGQVTNSTAVQVASNQVVYPDAFSGVCANVIYTMEKGAFHQDVVFTGQVNPAAYGFPTNTTRIQMITEFYDPPTPKVRQGTLHRETNQTLRANMVSPDLVDQTLGFGEFVLGRGRAYLTGVTNAVKGARAPGTPVGKEFRTVEGRHFLVETAEYQSIQKAMQMLPACPGGNPSTFNGSPSERKTDYAAIPVVPNKLQVTKANPLPVKSPIHAKLARPNSPSPSLSQANSKTAPTHAAANPSLVLDYVATIGSEMDDDYLFQSDTTYFISDSFSCYGNLTMEGGAVLKYAAVYIGDSSTDIHAGSVTIDIGGTFTCTATSYRPVILTAEDDDSVGQSLAGIDPNYTGVPSGANYGGGVTDSDAGCLNFNSLPPLSNLRFCYANTAINGTVDSVSLNDCQFVNCGTALESFNYYSPPLVFNNCLFANVQTMFYDGATMLACNFNNCTFDQVTQFEGLFGAFGASPGPFCATNCIFSNFQDDWTLYPVAGDFNVFYNNYANETFGSDARTLTNSPFQSVGAGNYYLAASMLQGLGTTNLASGLLADLAQKTTHPPLILSTNITTNAILSSVVPRDTNSALDLGYHYPAIDYLDTYCMISNATLVLTNGVVLAYYDAFGLWLENGGKLVSQGTPTTNNLIVYYRLVQEQPTNLWSWTNNAADAVANCYPILFYGTELSNYASMNLQFTSIDAMPGEIFLLWGDDANAGINNLSLKECEVRAGGASWVIWETNVAPTLTFTNNLFERPGSVYLHCNSSITAVNNLFLGDGGTNTPVNISDGNPGTPNLCLNNAFDGCGVYLEGHYSNNAYLNIVSMGMAPETSSLTTNLTWVAGPLGNYYQPTNSPLINKGNTNASLLGLYDYTATTNEIPETTNKVSIGYHYVAVDTNDHPLSTLWLGIPDYLVDTNGNGDADLVSWQMNYFGHLGLDPDSDPDGSGQSVLYDYQNGIDPNIISFTLLATNLYVRTNFVNLQLNVIGGVPFSITALVNETNLTNPTWQAYSTSNITVNLGTNDGQYTVWIGLRGGSTNSQQAWAELTITRDTVPPVLTITNPPMGTVSKPIIQLQGFVSETLANFTYSLSNAAGTLANQPIAIIGQFADTNTTAITTNYFQAYDVFLTNGVNSLTLCATDLAGNTTTTNLSLTLDYSSDTTPPVITITYPRTNSLVAGTNFTLLGLLDDDTATVIVSNAAGLNLNALVERGGFFSAPAVPLTSPTNQFVIVATDAAGNTSTQPLTVVQSTLALTLNPVTADQLSQATVTITGTISDGSQGVWVNGIAATVSGNAWSATIPALAGTSFTGTVQAGSDLSSPVGDMSFDVPMPPLVQISSFTENDNSLNLTECENYTDDLVYSQISVWSLNVGGGTVTTSSYLPPRFAPWGPGWPAGQSWRYCVAQTANSSSGGCEPGTPNWQIYSESLQINSQLQLAAGGPAQLGVQKLIRLTASAAPYTSIVVAEGGGAGDGPPVAGSQIQLFGQALTPTATNANVGEMCVAAAAGSTQNLPYQVVDTNGAVLPNYSINVQAQEALRILDANTGADLTGQTTNVVVGQQISLVCQPLSSNVTLSNFQWTIPGIAISNFVVSTDSLRTNGTVYTNLSTTTSNINFYWVDGTNNRVVQCSASVGGKKMTCQAIFNVLRPLGQITTFTGNVAVDTNYSSDGETYSFALHYGTAPALGVAGILFTNQVTMPIVNSYNYGNTNYSLEWIQEVNYSLRRFQTNTPTGTWYEREIALETNSVLDTGYPYPGEVTQLWAFDTPAESLDNSTNSVWKTVSVSDGFTMWLMFKPAGGQWVPLVSTTWNWGGTAVLNMVATNGSFWSLAGPTNNTPAYSNATAYPQWTDNILNHITIVPKP